MTQSIGVGRITSIKKKPGGLFDDDSDQDIKQKTSQKISSTPAQFQTDASLKKPTLSMGVKKKVGTLFDDSDDEKEEPPK